VRVDHRAGPGSGVAKVADIENLGSEHVLHLDYAGQHLAAIATPGFASIGEIVYVTFDLSQAHLIDPANGAVVASALGKAAA
jgi:ABC-type sugar transport system ATPase subunit